MSRLALYSRLAEYYDRIYWWKDYEKEVKFLQELYRKHNLKVVRILEVACGTGNHTRILARGGYDVTGVDLSEDVLRVARRKAGKGSTFLRGDMRDLPPGLRRDYDAVVCLFSAISYNLNEAELKKTLKGFYDHMKPEGILVFDTHFTRSGFWDGHRGEDIFDDGKTFGARLSISKREGDQGRITFSYLIKDGRRVVVLRNDVHRLGLFDPEDFLSVMKAVGFSRIERYMDWTTRKPTKKHGEQEYIFVGLKA